MKKMSILLGLFFSLTLTMQESKAQMAKIKKLTCPPPNLVKGIIDKHLANINNDIISKHNLSGILGQKGKVPFQLQRVTLNQQVFPKALKCSYIINNQEFLTLNITSK